MKDAESSPRHIEYAEILATSGLPSERLNLDNLARINLALTVNIGKRYLLVRDVLELKRGSIIELDKLAGEMSDIYINDVPLAKGEVVVIGDNLHVRIAEILGVAMEKNEGMVE